jgi:hypothetical protein
LLDGRRFDLVATNPPFSAFGSHDAKKRLRYWPAELARHHALTSDGIILFLGLSQWGQGEEAAKNLQVWPPFLQLRCGGRPQFRGVGTTRLAPIPKSRRVPGGPTHEMRENAGDSREYSAWCWRLADYRPAEKLARPRRPSWDTVQLPVLPSALREWHPSAVPGTYPIEPALVAEVRRYL